MEQNLPEVAKRFWNIVRTAFFMLRKGISKRNLMSDLTTMCKRTKNLIFFHSSGGRHMSPKEYEFNCSDTPRFTFPFKSKRPTHHLQDRVAALSAVLEMLNNHNENPNGEYLTVPSPYLPGFGRTPVVRPLRITDSPFPLIEEAGEDDGKVDKAAEEFIQSFYTNLKQQKKMIECNI